MAKHLSDEDQLYIYGLLKQNKLIAQVWPAYSWDKSEPAYTLLVDRDLALVEINRASDTEITERQLRTVLDRYCDKRSLTSYIAKHYQKRRDRKVNHPLKI